SIVIFDNRWRACLAAGQTKINKARKPHKEFIVMYTAMPRARPATIASAYPSFISLTLGRMMKSGIRLSESAYCNPRTHFLQTVQLLNYLNDRFAKLHGCRYLIRVRTERPEQFD